MPSSPDENVSKRNLSELGKMLVRYLADHEDRYPESLVEYERHCARQRHELDFQWLHQNVQYLGTGKSCKSMPPGTPIAWDRTMLAKTGETYVLFNAAYVRHVSEDACVDLGLTDFGASHSS